LEKKQDYVKRAKSYHKKEDMIQNLRLKASLKNPEEFYHKMINSKMENG
jgi:U3 small nucleolar RNA-associated protein 11